MKAQKKHKESTRYPLAVRIMALTLSLLVTGGVLTYLIMFVMSLFDKIA